MTPGLLVLIVATALALTFGGWRLRTDGRFGSRRNVMNAEIAGGAAAAGGSGDDPVSLLAGTGFAGRLGERATLLQFSSAFCAPCRATRRTLAEIAQVVPGVAHLEVDAEQHLDLVRRLNVLRTPTTLVLDTQGREVTRAAGAPRKEQVLAALSTALEG